MSDKKTDTTDPLLQKESLSENLKNRIRDKIPDGIDLSSIGSIDLSEAEKIATEEIIFLTEDDLIEGLEDFELIPLKSHEPSTEEKEVSKTDLSPGLRIKTISAADTEDKLTDGLKPDADEKYAISENVDEEISDKIEKKIITSDINDEPKDVVFETAPISKQEFQGSGTTADETETREKISVETDLDDNIKVDNINESVPGIEQVIADSVIEHKDEVVSDTHLQESRKITEDSVNIQLEDIFAEIEITEDNLPQRFKSPHKTDRAKFIDDPQLAGVTSVTEMSFHGDPLTERLARVIHAADASMSVITEKTDYYDEHAYLIEDMTFYHKTDISSIESEEIFYSDPDLDFFENAIIKNDFSRFIQEIDEYYDITKIESESQISQILGLNSEERELVEKDLFSGYYSTVDIETEIDFLNPDLDFINRVFVQNKDVSYIIDNPDSLIDDEKISIEDDITSGSAIVFEEDVEDLKSLMQRDYGQFPVSDEIAEVKEIIVPEKPADIIEESIPAEIEPPVFEEYPEIINITDKVIILEDKKEVTAFTKKFPGKEEDLVKLFSYLDGLFEKLPEETIKRFAESEYFDLYVKVMNEIGA